MSIYKPGGGGGGGGHSGTEGGGGAHPRYVFRGGRGLFLRFYAIIR